MHLLPVSRSEESSTSGALPVGQPIAMLHAEDAGPRASLERPPLVIASKLAAHAPGSSVGVQSAAVPMYDAGSNR